MSKTLTVLKPKALSSEQTERMVVRRVCLLGTPNKGKTGIEVLCDILGYRDLGRFHLEECKRLEAVNAFIASKAVERATFPKDDLQVARLELASKYNKDEFDNRSLKRLWLWSRGFFKTSILDVAHSVQLTIIDPNIRVLIMHNVLTEAAKILAIIKRQYSENEAFRRYFPEFCPRISKAGKIDFGKFDSVTLPNRSLKNLKEETFEICGVNSVKTGSHYDYIKKDDLVTEHSVTNDDMVRQSVDADGMSTFLFDDYTQGPEDYIGTRYHFADLYAQKLKKLDPKYISFKPGIVDGEPTFPEKFSKKALEELKTQLGSYQFSSQIQLNPIDPSAQVFKENWIQWYTELPTCNFYLLVDPATTKKKRSDYTAMIVIGVDEFDNWYIVDIIRDKLDVHERIDTAWELAEKWNIVKCLWESEGFQLTDVSIIVDRRKSDKFKFPIESVKTGGVSKIDRIRGLQPYYEKGQIYWPSPSGPHSIVRFNKFHGRRMNYIDDLTMEYQTFPMAEHEDLLDAHSMILKVNRRLPMEKDKPRRLEPNSWGALVLKNRKGSRSGKLVRSHIH